MQDSAGHLTNHNKDAVQSTNKERETEQVVSWFTNFPAVGTAWLSFKFLSVYCVICVRKYYFDQVLASVLFNSISHYVYFETGNYYCKWQCLIQFWCSRIQRGLEAVTF